MPNPTSNSLRSLRQPLWSDTLRGGALRFQKDDGKVTTETDSSSDTTSLSSWSWLVTLVLPLWCIYISNQWSRSSIYYLVDFSDSATAFSAMNVDIGFTEAQYGILASVAFTALFAIASLAAGAAADRYDRKALTTVAAVGWSAATLATAVAATSYSQVLILRILMGLACAFSTPTAYTLIQQQVPKDRVSLATSLYGTGVALGGALASLSILLDSNIGWQSTMVVIAAFGFASAGLCTVLLPADPKTESSNQNEKETIANVLGKDGSKENDGSNVLSAFTGDVSKIVSSPRVKWLYLGSFFRFSAGLSIGVWSAPYFRMMFPDNASDYAVAQAVITAVAGSTSGVLGGYIADKVSVDNGANDIDSVGRKLWIPVVGSLLAAPTWYIAVQGLGGSEAVPVFQNSMAWLAVSYFVAECWFGPTISSLQTTVGSKVGGTAQGLFTLTGAVANLAPTLLGYLYGRSNDIEMSPGLADLLAVGVCFAYVSCAICFALSAQSGPPIDES